MRYLLLLLLVGCGGGEAPQCAPVKVQLFGDSTMAGFDGETRLSAYAPSVFLQEALGVTVENRAVNGSNSSQLLAGNDGGNAPWPKSTNGDVVVVNHGINDARAKTPIDIYKANLKAFAGPWRIVFETPNPAPGVEEYAVAMREVAAELGAPVADTFSYMQGHLDMIPDGIHPTTNGYALIVRDVLAPTVASLICK